MPADGAPGRGPLDGLTVVDLSTVLAGPYATMILGDLGADIIKVEPPEGDATRGWGPPWVGDASRGTRTAAYYLAINRNKRSIRLDLRSTAGAEVLRRLLSTADVLVENFRPGSLERLGFPEARLREINPRLVHLAISGYGTTGPAANRPGYDFVIQAVGGLMSITGEPDEVGGRPMKVGVAISDIVTGLYAAIGVLAGLVDRTGSGEPVRPSERASAGQRIEASLLGSTLAILVNQAQNAFVSGRSPVRRGNAHPNIVPYETFTASDGELAIAVGSERQWPRFCEALGLPALAADPRFRSNGDRVEHRAELRPILADRLLERTVDAWGAALDAAEVPWGRVADVTAALASPEAAALSMTVEVEHPAFGVLRQVGIPLRFDATPGSVRSAPPLLGEHTDAILGELGYSSSDIDRLRADGVV